MAPSPVEARGDAQGGRRPTSSPPSLLGRTVSLVLGLVRLLVSLFWSIGARLHRWVATRGRAARGRPACAIVSVGGLTIGGAGKTPAAAAVARLLAERGLRVVLASRGYGGRHRDPVTVVSDGRHVRANAAKTGDESLVLAAHAPGVPVLVGRDRRVVGHRAVAGFGADVLVLDDGFQHHALDRDFDLVCVDASAALGNGRVVPAGPLREPARALRVADALLIVDRDEGEEIDARLRKAMPEQTPVFHGTRHPVSLTPLGGGASSAPESLRGVEVGLLAGIARPASLRRSLERLGAKVVAERSFPDHHPYAERDFARGIAAGEDKGELHWITTEKDAYKILPRWVEGERISVLRMELRIDEADDLARRLAEVVGERQRGVEDAPQGDA